MGWNTESYKLLLSIVWFIIIIPSSVSTSTTTIHELCGDSGELSSIESAYGTIRYTTTCNSTATSSITIKMPTGSAHRFAVIEGVAIKSDSSPCQGHSGMLNISILSFCIEPQGFHVFHQSSESLTITAIGIIPSFIIKYYTTGKLLKYVLSKHSWGLAARYK